MKAGEVWIFTEDVKAVRSGGQKGTRKIPDEQLKVSCLICFSVREQDKGC